MKISLSGHVTCEISVDMDFEDFNETLWAELTPFEQKKLIADRLRKQIVLPEDIIDIEVRVRET